MEDAKISRRSFLTGAAVLGGATALGALAGCAPQGGGEAKAAAAPSQPAGAGESGAGWLGEAPVIDESALAETIDTDILVVGNGMAGTVCALVAAENGAQVTLIEKNPAGVGLRSSAISAVGSRYQQAAGVEINKEDLVNDVASYALNQCDMRLIRSWADNSADVVNWLGDLYEKNGFTFIWNTPCPKAHATGCGRPAMAPSMPPTTPRYTYIYSVLAAVMKHYEEVGGTFMPTTKLVSLIKEGDSVVGAYAENADEKPIRINASKGVVVATGGYVNNNEMYVARQNGLDKSLTGPLNFARPKATASRPACGRARIWTRSLRP